MSTHTVTAEQASQPTYAGVRVGVVLVGRDGAGTPKTRLLIRYDDVHRAVDLAAGETTELTGRGRLCVDAIEPPATDAERGRLTLTFELDDA